MPTVRPMRESDVRGVHDVKNLAFADLERRLGEPEHPQPDFETSAMRLRHLLHTDPEGAWVAARDGEVVGCALALVREGLWGLSLLAVRPDVQSSGIGRELLRRAHDYADGARGRVILASPDPRGLRAYAKLGLALHPALRVHGVPHGVEAPPGVRPGTADDIPFIEDVDRHVRGAAHGPDIAVALQAGVELLIAPERGYAMVRGGDVFLLAAYEEGGAREILRAILARGVETEVDWLSSAQGWAVEECVAAGLQFSGKAGAVLLDGDVGPFRPYIPSGAYL